MSLAELKKEAVSLTAEEKRELADFLREQVEPQLAERRARVSALMREMDAGRKFSRADFESVGDEGNELAQVAEASGSLDFLAGEPELYSDADVIPARANPGFGNGPPEVPAR